MSMTIRRTHTESDAVEGKRERQTTHGEPPSVPLDADLPFISPYEDVERERFALDEITSDGDITVDGRLIGTPRRYLDPAGVCGSMLPEGYAALPAGLFDPELPCAQEAVSSAETCRLSGPDDGQVWIEPGTTGPALTDFDPISRLLLEPNLFAEAGTVAGLTLTAAELLSSRATFPENAASGGDGLVGLAGMESTSLPSVLGGAVALGLDVAGECENVEAEGLEGREAAATVAGRVALREGLACGFRAAAPLLALTPVVGPILAVLAAGGADIAASALTRPLQVDGENPPDDIRR